MRIGGFQKFTLIDYPGKVAAIVFTQGCNFRCGYCHNPQLVCSPQFQVPIEEAMVLEFLRSRRGKLQGVVVTGGEPTIQKGLLDFLRKLKAMGYAVKLDTNGSHPDVLAGAMELGLVDFVAMDIKTSLGRYEEAIGVKADLECLRASIELIKNSGLAHQFRTTLVKTHCSKKDVEDILGLICNSSQYVLQGFTPSSTIIDPGLLTRERYTSRDVQEFQAAYGR